MAAKSTSRTPRYAKPARPVVIQANGKRLGGFRANAKVNHQMGTDALQRRADAFAGTACTATVCVSDITQ